MLNKRESSQEFKIWGRYLHDLYNCLFLQLYREPIQLWGVVEEMQLKTVLEEIVQQWVFL